MREKIVDAINGVKVLAIVLAVSFGGAKLFARDEDSFVAIMVMGLSAAVVGLEMNYRAAKRGKSNEQGPIQRR